MPTGVRDFFSKYDLASDRQHPYSRPLHTKCIFLIYWGANNCLLFRTSALSEHMHQLSVIVRIINDTHLQWRPHSHWLTSSLSGDLQPSDVWQTRHPTVLPFSLCEGRVQCFLLFVFHIHVFFSPFKFLSEKSCYNWCFTCFTLSCHWAVIKSTSFRLFPVAVAAVNWFAGLFFYAP